MRVLIPGGRWAWIGRNGSWSGIFMRGLWSRRNLTGSMGMCGVWCGERSGSLSIRGIIRLLYAEGEQPSDEVKRYVESRLDRLRWKVDVVLSHTTPLKYEPVEVFMAGVDQSKVDKSTEKWLDGIEDRLDYGKWYCGHYHTEKKVDRVEIMFENFEVFSGDKKFL